MDPELAAIERELFTEKEEVGRQGAWHGGPGFHAGGGNGGSKAGAGCTGGERAAQRVAGSWSGGRGWLLRERYGTVG